MNEEELRQLTGMITTRMWLVVLALGVLGAGLMAVGIPLQIGAALLTLAALLAPVAVVAAAASLLRAPATQIPRWLLWVGGVGTVVGLGWLLTVPGQESAIIVFALGVWLLVVGILSAAVLAITR